MFKFFSVTRIAISLFAGTSAYAAVPGADEIRAILDLPVLADLLAEGAVIKRIEKVDIKANVYEIEAGNCVAKVRVIRDQSGVSNAKAESLGAECGG